MSLSNATYPAQVIYTFLLTQIACIGPLFWFWLNVARGRMKRDMKIRLCSLNFNFKKSCEVSVSRFISIPRMILSPISIHFLNSSKSSLLSKGLLDLDLILTWFLKSSWFVVTKTYWSQVFQMIYMHKLYCVDFISSS